MAATTTTTKAKLQLVDEPRTTHGDVQVVQLDRERRFTDDDVHRQLIA
jgi:hypothetical protein